MKQKRHILAALLLSALVVPTQSYAGPHSDDLGKCMMESTTVSDRNNLVRWMFAASSLHPAVKSISAVTEVQLDAANRETGGLVMKVLTVSCKDQAEKAIRYEGKSALELAFGALGELAGQELLGSPEVTAGMEGLTKYLDVDKLKAAFAPKGNQ